MMIAGMKRIVSRCQPISTKISLLRRQKPMLTLGGPALFSSDSQQVKTSSQLAGRRAAEVSSKSASVKSIDTILAHAGVEDIPNAPMSPPLSLSTTFSRPPDGVYRDEDWIYSRHGSPTKYLLETTIAALECHGDDRPYDDAVCCAVSSGMAGVNTIITAHGSSTCVLIPHDLYHGVPTLLEDVLRNLGITYERVVFQNVDDVVEKVSQVSAERAVVWMETPSNPQCQVIDIMSICSALKATNTRAKVTTVVDSTMATPCLTQPLRLGADLAFHSGTKGIAGHSDALIGLVTASPWTERGKEMGPLLQQVQIKAGAVASPFDCWLTLRGLRTLHVRVERASQTALRLARFLDSHKDVKVTHYPGLEAQPLHDIAKKQMKGHFGGVLSFEMETEAEAMAVTGALRTAQRATSLGGTETLVEHRASIEPPGRIVSPPGLIRVSVGLESADDIIQDFQTALRIAMEVT